MYAGLEEPVEVAHMAVHMPRGGAVGEWFGGPSAITGEVEALWGVELAVARSSTDKPSKVKPPDYPEGVRVAVQKAAKAEAKAEAWLRRREAQAAAVRARRG